MLCARALVRALNDAKNRAQQGCAMQFSEITLSIFRFKLATCGSQSCDNFIALTQCVFFSSF